MSEVLVGTSDVTLWLEIMTAVEGLWIAPVDSVCGI
jgi:hypothetical protein